jgi:hypothetical protein
MFFFFFGFHVTYLWCEKIELEIEHHGRNSWEKLMERVSKIVYSNIRVIHNPEMSIILPAVHVYKIYEMSIHFYF